MSLLPPPPHAVHTSSMQYRRIPSSHLHISASPPISNTTRLRTRPASPSVQDYKVFARHNKFGTFEVPKEFLNTHEKASVAVAPKAVQQARRACMCPPWHNTCCAVRTARLRTVRSYLIAIRMPLHRVSSCTLAPYSLHPGCTKGFYPLSCTTHVLMHGYAITPVVFCACPG